MIVGRKTSAYSQIKYERSLGQISIKLADLELTMIKSVEIISGVPERILFCLLGAETVDVLSSKLEKVIEAFAKPTLQLIKVATRTNVLRIE